MIRDIIKNKELKEETGNIICLWEVFDEYFKEIEETYKINGEEAIKLVYSAIDALNALNMLKLCSPKIAELFEEIYELNNQIIPRYEEIINKVILESAKNVVKKFHESELDKYYKKLKREFLIEGKPLGNHIKELIDNKKFKKKKFLHIYTTNYDGIIDTLLNYNIYENNKNMGNTNKKMDFLGRDGFGGSHEEYKHFNGIFKIENENIILHIHGSYKFRRLFRMTVKMTKEYVKKQQSKGGNFTVDFPVIIYNNREIKQKIIEENDVLSKYFEYFKFSLRECSKFVIWGNSLKTDPHIAKAICQNFDKEKPLYIIDINPNSVIDNLQSECKNKKFKNIKTLKDLGFNTPPKTKEELLELFKK
jgi:NAD-dependent SIR2 family protein deacetylase